MLNLNPAYKRIALVWNSGLSEAPAEAELIAAYLRAQGATLGLGELTNLVLRDRIQQREFDLVIAMGGDGTMLRAGHLCAPIHVPILGVNMGRLGFLMEVERKDWRSLLPRLLKRDLKAEEARWREEQAKETPGIVARQYRITNPNVVGRLVSEIDLHRLGAVNLSRVRRGDKVSAASGQTRLQLGDVVMVVGQEAEVSKMSVLLGEQVEVTMDVNTDVKSVDVYVTEDSLVGRKLKSLKIWESYTVVITRIRREGLEITPTGVASLEIGDSIRVVGQSAAVDDFVHLVAGKPGRRQETQMATFLVGLVLGVAIGTIHIPLPNGLDLKLGGAGGVFLVGLLCVIIYFVAGALNNAATANAWGYVVFSLQLVFADLGPT